MTKKTTEQMQSGMLVNLATFVLGIKMHLTCFAHLIQLATSNSVVKVIGKDKDEKIDNSNVNKHVFFFLNWVFHLTITHPLQFL